MLPEIAALVLSSAPSLKHDASAHEGPSFCSITASVAAVNESLFELGITEEVGFLDTFIVARYSDDRFIRVTKAQDGNSYFIGVPDLADLMHAALHAVELKFTGDANWNHAGWDGPNGFGMLAKMWECK